MSAGAFSFTRYEYNGGAIVRRIRVQPETLGLTLGGTANTAPTAALAPTGLETLKFRSGRRGFGVKPRTVTVRMTADGTGSTGDYLGTGSLHTIPILQESVWQGYAAEQTGTYLGIACEFVNKSNEEIS